jgi:hypothetical protein
VSAVNLNACIRHQDTDPEVSWEYRFPNGQWAFVFSDRSAPLRFKLERPKTDVVERGLSTEQVEARLAEIATLPAKEKA